MQRHFVRKIDRQSLSALAMIAYMLSSLVLSPNKKYQECRDFVKAYRCGDNNILFLPLQFFFVGDVLRFRGEFPDNDLKCLFPQVYSGAMQYFVFSETLPIRNSDLQGLVNLFGVRSVPGAGLGTPYRGPEIFKQTDRYITALYFEKANNIFKKYGLGIESSARFLELFFEEYMSMIDQKLFLESFRGARQMSFDCFLYGSTEAQCPFPQVVKNRYDI